MFGYVRAPQIPVAILFHDVIWNKAYCIAVKVNKKNISDKGQALLNQARRPRLLGTSVCLSVCVRPRDYYYIQMILNLYNQLNKFVKFRNVTNQLYAWTWLL